MDAGAAMAGQDRHPARSGPGRASRALLRLRTVLTNQLRLWDRALDDLRPWEQEGSLRWHGNRLDGATLDADELSTTG
jgi:hypothetical protein